MISLYSSVNRSVSYLSILHQVRQHHNHPTLSLIDHLPEVSTGGLHWSLGNNEPFPLLVALFVYRGVPCTRVENIIQNNAVFSSSRMVRIRLPIVDHPTRQHKIGSVTNLLNSEFKVKVRKCESYYTLTFA